MAARIADRCVAGVALAVVLGVYSWSLWGSPAFGMLADQAYHRVLAAEFDQAWRDGGFPPRWAAGANGGRGSAGFVIYPPLFAFLTVCWVRLGVPLVEALRLAVLTAAAGAFGGVFYVARGWLSRRRSALAATVVLLLPGVTFVALSRGMFPHFAALGWVALLLGAGQRAMLGRRPRFQAVLVVLAAAGLVVTHTLTAYLLTLFLLVIYPLATKALGVRGTARAAAMAAAAAALSCWYWLPLVHAGGYTRVSYLAESHPYLDSVFGGPALGSDVRGDAAEGDAGGQDWIFLNDLGRYIVAAQSLLALLVALVLGAKSNMGSKDCPGARQREPASDVLFLRALPWVAGFAFLAATEPGARLLLLLPKVELIQFAWRWQLLISLWCGVGLASLPTEKRSALPAAVAAMTLLFFSPLLSRSRTLPEEQRHDLPAVLSRAQFEALPPLDRAAYAGNLLELRPNRVDDRYYLPAPFGRAEVASGAARIEPGILRTSYREYRVEANGPATIRLVTYQAPGWSARIDGREARIGLERETGLQLIEVPPGTHRIEVDYRVPWGWQRIGDVPSESVPFVGACKRLNRLPAQAGDRFSGPLRRSAGPGSPGKSRASPWSG
jgi:hypothetical protein